MYRVVPIYENFVVYLHIVKSFDISTSRYVFYPELGCQFSKIFVANTDNWCWLAPNNNNSSHGYEKRTEMTEVTYKLPYVSRSVARLVFGMNEIRFLSIPPYFWVRNFRCLFIQSDNKKHVRTCYLELANSTFVPSTDSQLSKLFYWTLHWHIARFCASCA